jgi:hypothetical protein
VFQNAGNILTGQPAIGVGEIEHRTDVGILLAVVAAVRALVVAVQLRQHVASVELNIRKRLLTMNSPTYRCGTDSESHPGCRRAVRGAVGKGRVADEVQFLRSRGAGERILEDVQRLGRVADNINLRHASQSLGNVGARHVLDDPAKIAINEPAGECQVVSEFVLVAARDFILELRAGSGSDLLEVAAPPWNAILPPGT